MERWGGEGVVQPNVVAEHGVRSQRDLVDANQVDAVDNVRHDRFKRVFTMLSRQRGVRRGFNADHAPFSAHALMTASGFIRGVFQSARAPAWVMKTGVLLAAMVSSEV